MKRPNKPQAGFTIVELSLSMTLLGVLLFILVVSAMNFVNIYDKGITLKRVNQSGANIGEELQANLRASSEVTVRRSPGGTATGVCTGSYSFVWSVYGSGSGLTNNTATIPLSYSDGSPVSFAQVKDPSKDLCKPGSTVKPYKGTNLAQPYQSTELLGDGLVIRDPSTATNQGGLDVILSPDNKLTTVIYTISTNGGDDIISDSSNRASCQGGNSSSFCALNTFVITAYSEGVYN
jgi:prepilin-type N-terminal cleavage/methylation domain-containing protein